MTAQDVDEQSLARVAALWRRQLVLVGVAAVLIVLCLVLMAMARHRGDPGAVAAGAAADAGLPGRPADRSVRLLVWPAAAGAVGAFVLLGAVVAHIVRVATFTFRRASGE